MLQVESAGALELEYLLVSVVVFRSCVSLSHFVSFEVRISTFFG